MFEKPPFSKAEEKKIVDAIKSAEKNTSGEIRIHVEKHCKTEDTYERAIDVFEELGMTATEQRNGVLIYMAIEDRKFAIIGDQGINDVVPANFWDATKNRMVDHFKKGEMAEGFAAGILHAGDQLKKHFPYQKDDENELDDEISYGS